MRKVKNLVVGCGLSGVVMAERLASQLGEEVLIVERRDHIGGNIYDYKDRNGITVHKYGPHVFHTNHKAVWDYLSHFTDWHYFMYRVKAVIDGMEVNIPFNLDSLHKVFPKALAEKLESKLLEKYNYNTKVPILELKKSKDSDLEFLARYVYEKVFLGYTVKQWGVKPEDLDPSVSGRVPVCLSRDDRYFQDRYQAIPVHGYTAIVENMLKNPLIKVELKTDYADIKTEVQYDRLFYSGSIDELFDYKLGKLPYRSLNLKFVEYKKEYYQSGPQINYPENYDFTRSVEYKYYLNEQSDNTTISYEYPEAFEEGKNERYYPIPNDTSSELYHKYASMKCDRGEVYFLGRLGDYRYYDMDKAVARAVQLFETLT